MSNFEKLILYTPENYKDLKLVRSTLTYPFWGVPEKENYAFNNVILKKYIFSKKYYTISSDQEKADYIFLPYQFWSVENKNPKIINEFISISRRIKKPLLIDAIGDRMDKIKIPNSVILRYAQYRKHLQENDVIVPLYTEDLSEISFPGSILPLNKENIPSVGFVGWTNLPILKYIKTYLKETPVFLLSILLNRYQIYRKGIFLRSKVIKKLKLSKKIRNNFIERSFYSGNKKTLKISSEIARKEFIKNIVDSQYSLCVKGDANQSARFFEVLSLGRIPLFVDTECVLPLENKINYKDFCLFVDYKDLNNIEEIISNFHKGISNEHFIEMQKNARYAYQKYLRMDSYTEHLIEILKNRVKNDKNK